MMRTITVFITTAREPEIWAFAGTGRKEAIADPLGPTENPGLEVALVKGARIGCA
jgi:hypothetical protein